MKHGSFMERFDVSTIMHSAQPTKEVMVPHLSFPNESAEYRTARNALLDAEIALRRRLETVAAQRPCPPAAQCPKISCSSGSARTSGPSR